MSLTTRNELYQSWQTAFAEWYRHKTEATAADETQARQAFVSFCKQTRRQSRQDAVG